MALPKKVFSFLFLIFMSHTNLQSGHFISFIMPCYNCEKTVQESIDSIYAQNIQYPFEVICTDDGSCDGTLSILRRNEKKYDNFKVYVHEKNKSGGAASNTCVSHSKGDLIFRLDSDNILAKDTMNKLVALVDKTGCDGASVEELKFFKGDKIQHGSWFFRAKNNICDVKHIITHINNPASSGNYLFTRESYDRAGGYPVEHGSDTFIFGFRQFATGSKIAILPGSFYWHRQEGDSYWSREEVKGTNKLRILQTFQEFLYIFSEDSKRLILSMNETPQNILDLIQNKKLKLAS